MFQGIAKPITRVYFGVRSRIHLRHFRGRSIHSPFMYGLVRNVFMKSRIDGPDFRLYERLREADISESTAVLLQNLFTYSGMNGYRLTGAKEETRSAECVRKKGRNLCILLPGVPVRALMEAARKASDHQDILVVLSPHRTRRGRETAQSIRHHYPCVSVDRCNMVICIFDARLQPQHYRI